MNDAFGEYRCEYRFREFSRGAEYPHEMLSFPLLPWHLGKTTFRVKQAWPLVSALLSVIYQHTHTHTAPGKQLNGIRRRRKKRGRKKERGEKMKEEGSVRDVGGTAAVAAAAAAKETAGGEYSGLVSDVN